MNYIYSIIVLLTFLTALTGCQKDCAKSTRDCTVIKYSCDAQEKVCGCDGLTYSCALAAECEGGLSEYTSGACN